MPHSSLFTVERLDPAAFDDVLDSLPPEVSISIEQSGRFNVMYAENPAMDQYGNFVVRDGETVVAAVSLQRYARPLRESIMTVSGPVWAVERTPETEERVVRSLMETIRADKTVRPLMLRLQLQHPEAVPGATPAIERGQFEREVVVELENTPQELKRTFSASTRTRIRKAGRLGVEIREITEDRDEVFRSQCYPILLETAERNGFAPLPVSFPVRFLRHFPDLATLYVAYAPEPGADLEEQKVPVAWAITWRFHHHGCYYLAGSNALARSTNAMHCMADRYLTDLRDAGMRTVGLTGISSERWPELASLEGFKLSFSKNIVECPRLYDIPFHPRRYRAVRALVLGRQRIRKATS